MEGQLYPLGYDPTASSVDNLVLEERHIIGTYQDRTRRAVILEKGHYYTETLKVRDASGRTLTLGQDYTPILANGEATALQGKPVSAGVLILDPKVDDRVYIDAQMVGGEYCFLGNVLSSIYDTLQNDSRSIEYSKLQNRPNTVKAVRHNHSLAQTYGWEVFKAELVRITNAIITTNKRDIAEVRNSLKASSGTNTSRIEALSTLIDMHVTREDNPHQLTLKQVRLEYYDGRYIVTKDRIYDSLTDRQFLTPAAIKRYLVDQAYSPFSEHVNDRNNPHGVTLQQIDAYSAIQIDDLVSTKYGANDQVYNATHLDNYSYSQLIDYLRSDLDAGRVMNGTLNVHRLGSGDPSSRTVLVNGKWRTLSDIFNQYSRPKPKLLYAGNLGYDTTAWSTLVSRYSDSTAYPPGTGVLYGEQYISYNDIGPSIWTTKGVLMQLAVRDSNDTWTHICLVDHVSNHRVEDASSNVWWY